MCDVCLGRTPSRPTGEEFDRIREKIRTLLSEKNLDEKALAAAFRGREQLQSREVIAYLLDEGWLEWKEGLLYWKGQ